MAWRDLVCAYAWPCDEAVRVVAGPTSACPNGESGGDFSKSNGPNIGGFEINVIAHPQWTVAELLDAATNIAAAYSIWRDQGWDPWSCFP
jgi:hypothetical protein